MRKTNDKKRRNKEREMRKGNEMEGRKKRTGSKSDGKGEAVIG